MDGRPNRRNRAPIFQIPTKLCGHGLVNLLKRITNAHLLLESFLRKFTLNLGS